ncbi:MAG: TRAP transporter substrate-binding protein [Deltaproteobacteria bacterium]|nr:TRAP transporter substrate-binding protein [Deltaproteobacteria bacterium]
MKKRSLLSMVLLMATGLLISVLGQGIVYCADKPIELKFISPYYDQHLVAKNAFMPWIDQVFKKSNGKLKIIFFPPNSIMKMNEVFEGTKAGLVDIGSSLCAQNQGKFPLIELLEMPILFSSAETASRVYWDLYEKYPEFRDQFKGTKVLWLWMSAITQIQTTKKPIRTPEDLKGMKIAGHSKGQLDAMHALGANPIEIAPPEMYLGLERGIAEGALMSFVGAKGVKVFDVVRYSTKADLQAVSFYSVITPKKYEALPPDIKNVLDEMTGAYFSRECGATLDRSDEEVIADVKKQGIDIYVVPPDEKEKWVEAVMPVREAMFKAVEAKGYKNAREMINTAIDLAKEYDKK